MSDEYADPSNDRTLSSDDPREPRPADARIAIHARSKDVADALWQGFEKRLRKKPMLALLRVQANDADVAVHILAPEDFADDAAARAKIAEISAGVATRKILIDPNPSSIPEASGRISQALAELAALPGCFRIAWQENVGADPIPHQARATLKLLHAELATPGPMEAAPAEPDRARKKALRREARSARKRGEGSRQKDGERASRKAASATGSATALENADAAPARKQDRAGKRAQKRAAKKAEKMQREASGSAAAKTGEPNSARDGKQGRAERRAQKRSAKSEKASKDGKQKAGRGPRKSRKVAAGRSAEGAALSDPRSEKRAKRKALKEPSRENKNDTPTKVKREGAAGDVARVKPPAAIRALAKQKTSASAPREAAEPRARALSLAIAGLGEASNAALTQSLQRAIRENNGPVGLNPSDRKRDVAIYAFDEPALSAGEIAQSASVIAGDGARVRIFLERAVSPTGSLEEENRAIAVLASASNGSLVRLGGKIQRYGGNAMIADGVLTGTGWDLVAKSILGILSVRLAKYFPVRTPLPSPPDLLEVRTLAARAPEFLAQFGWSKTSAPKLLGASVSKAEMDALIDEALVLSPETTLDLHSPVAWPESFSDRASTFEVLGLEFLTAPLSYWYDKANGRNGSHIAEIDAALKDRQIKASEILSRAEKLMIGFVEKHPAGAPPPAAWQEDAVSRRARVFSLYALCCKMALKLRVKFDAESCSAILLGLFDLIEVLRADDLYKPASAEGYEQDFLLIGLGLALRGTAYGDRLLAESLERLRLLQLDAGLTSDGVWRAGPISEHVALLSGLKVLIGDLNKSGAAPVDSLAAIAKKMTVFAEAMLKSNGQPPMIDGKKQKSYGRHLSGTRLALAQAGGKKVAKTKIEAMPRLTDTYVFREAQYFISHTTQKVSDESSLVVLHADTPSFADGDPGGVTLVFAHGQDDLLIRAAAPERADKKDRSPLFDPALRNGYHIDGAGFAAGGAIRQGAARIVKSWRGPGWAAAKSVDEINAAGSVSRVVVHLKALHALIVVDVLESANGAERTFEQFWHIASGLAVPASGEASLRFASTPAGGMSIAFDSQGETAIEAEGEGTLVRRGGRFAKGAFASLFQWTDQAAPAAIEFAEDESDGWVVLASGAGLKGRLALHGDEFVCEIAAGG
jgi:hypothetical protein